jgi:hypothetical protein
VKRDGNDKLSRPRYPKKKRALAFLLGLFSGRVLRSGEHTVPEEALEALAAQEIPFKVRTQNPKRVDDGLN